MRVKIKKSWIWTRSETAFYKKFLKGNTLHVCSGKSLIGDVRIDLFERADVKGDYRHLPFKDKSFDSVVCDPPWAKTEALDKGLSWLFELRRVARKRIIIIHPTPFKIRGTTPCKAFLVRARGIMYKNLLVYDVNVTLKGSVNNPRLKSFNQ